MTISGKALKISVGVLALIIVGGVIVLNSRNGALLQGNFNNSTKVTSDPGNSSEITMTTRSGSTTSFTTAVTEGGSSDTYTLELNRIPTADVTVSTTTNTAQIKASPTTLTFTARNWDTAQTITVSAVDDPIIEGPQTETIDTTFTSSDPFYNFSDSYPVIVIDNDK